GSSSFNNLRNESLGTLINAATFNQAFAQSTNDIQLTYTLATGEIVNGLVEYFNQPTFLAGDYNNNGIVDSGDYVVWRKNQGTTNALPNDPNGGMIGQAQYNTWRLNFGNQAGAGSGSAVSGSQVPEPGTMALALLLLGALQLPRRRRFSALGAAL